MPVWLCKSNFLLKTMVVHDSTSFNIGFIASIWDDRVEAMFELMALKWGKFEERDKLGLKS